MRNLMLTATFVAGTALTAGAQTPQTQPAKPAVPGVMVTVVGCVTREAATPQTASRSGQAAAPQFVLTDNSTPATPPGARTDGATSSGATLDGGQSARRTMYVLVPRDASLDLAAHVNHTVRVTGASTAPQTTAPLAGRSPNAVPVPGDTAPPGATGTAFDTSNLPTLAVTSLAMVATTCK